MFCRSSSARCRSSRWEVISSRRCTVWRYSSSAETLTTAHLADAGADGGNALLRFAEAEVRLPEGLCQRVGQLVVLPDALLDLLKLRLHALKLQFAAVALVGMLVHARAQGVDLLRLILQAALRLGALAVGGVEQLAHAVEFGLAGGQFRVVALELGGVFRQRVYADFQLRLAVGEQFGHVLGLTAEALVVRRGRLRGSRWRVARWTRPSPVSARSFSPFSRRA